MMSEILNQVINKIALAEQHGKEYAIYLGIIRGCTITLNSYIGNNVNVLAKSRKDVKTFDKN